MAIPYKSVSVKDNDDPAYKYHKYFTCGKNNHNYTKSDEYSFTSLFRQRLKLMN